MRPKSAFILAAGAIALGLLAGGATALAKSGSNDSGPSTKGPALGRRILVTGLGRELPTIVRRVSATRAVADCPPPVRVVSSLQVAADYLGLSVDELRNELQGGGSLAEIAKEHGKSVDGLEQAVIDAAKAELDQRVAAGEITADEEQQVLDGLRSHIADFVSATFPPTPAEPPLGDPAAAAANYLGLSADQLAQELQDGKSLADAAKAHGKSVNGLEEAVIDGAKSALDKSVAAGDITADEAQQALSQLNSQIDGFVNGNGDLSIRIGAEGIQVRIGPPGTEGPYRTAADYLGLTVHELVTELQAGKSLADIAAEQGKSVDGLKQALIKAGAGDGEQSVDDLVNQKGLPGPPCGEVPLAIGIEVPRPDSPDTP
jgi:polyhydroxyalkanoate synthesis regulator phasin